LSLYFVHSNVLTQFGGEKMKIQYLIPVVLIATLVLGSVTAMGFESKATVKQNKLTRRKKNRK